MEIEDYKRRIVLIIDRHIEEYKSPPGSKEWDEKGYKPSRKVLEKKFNMSYNKILTSLGYIPRNRSPIRMLSNEKLLNILKHKAAITGLTPTYDELRLDSTIPNPKIFFERFGSYNNALKLAGLNLNIDRDSVALLKELKELLKILE